MVRRDIMRGTLALILVFAFCAVQVALFTINIPNENKETITYAMGQLSGMVTTALAFYFATTQGSHEKTQLLATRPNSGDPEEIPSPQFGKEP